ncbi:MAG: hypothetical protein JNL67_04035 [Planctomycetaceae bacterium]|nr:hypothetical protein [Planctomycetaceae bacterium]
MPTSRIQVVDPSIQVLAANHTWRDEPRVWPPLERDGQKRGLMLALGYVLTWSLAHLSFYCYFRQFAEPLLGMASFQVWLGLFFGQLASVLMWPIGQSLRGWTHHLAALLLIAGGCYLCSNLLKGSTNQWWIGLVALVLGCKSAWWAMHQPIRRRAGGLMLGQPSPGRGAAPSRVGNFSLSQWLVFSLWVAVAMSLVGELQRDWSLSAGLLACFGGFSLFLAVHRFAFHQLLWPSQDTWPANSGSGWQNVDRAGILLFVLALQSILGWGIIQYYGATPQAGSVFLICAVAAWWQAFDLWFSNLVQINQSPTHHLATTAIAAGKSPEYWLTESRH